MPYWYSQKEKWLQRIGAGIVLQNLQMYLKYPLLAYLNLQPALFVLKLLPLTIQSTSEEHFWALTF